MTLIGKIFTVLIFIMSLMFMAFSVMVFATHKNWKMLVMNETATAEFPLGLKKQIEQQRMTNEALRAENDSVRDALARERAARRQAIASMQTKLVQNQELLEQKEEELGDLTAAHGAMATAVKDAQVLLERLTAEVAAVREDVRNTQSDRDAQFAKVVELTDKIHEAEGAKARLEERQKQMLDEVSKMKKVMDKVGVTVDTNVDKIPPPLDGLVTAVRNSNLVEISLGADDGLLVGHELDVYRDNTYLGKVIIRRTDPNRAVGEILKETVRGQIKKGDRVSTKLS